jgi:hypothetical protein
MSAFMTELALTGILVWKKILLLADVSFFRRPKMLVSIIRFVTGRVP